MAIKLFVAGLPYAVTSDELQSMFADYGTVASAQVITDRDTGRSKGFGFVEFDSDDEGNAAIAGLNGKDMNGRSLAVNVARPREDRPNRSGSNGGGFGRRPGAFDRDRGGNTVGNSFRPGRR